MNTRVSKKYYLIPLFYIGLIGALLYLQFAREEPFHLRFGSLEVTGHIIAGQTDPPALADISLRMSGLSFSFGRTTQVRVALENGSSQSVSFKSYSTIPNGVQLAFSSGLSLQFLVRGEGQDILSIIPSVPAGVQVSSVTLPYSVSKGDRTKSRSGIPVLTVTQSTSGGDETHVLSLPFQSQVEPNDNTIVLAATGGKFGPASYGPAAKPNLDPVVYWFEQNGDLPDPAAFSKAVKSFLDKAWSGWTSTRFDQAAGTWQMRDGSPSFSELILTSLLSESLTRDSYGTWFAAMRNAAALNPGGLTLESAPYFGNIISSYSTYAASQAQVLLDDEQQIQQGGDAAFAIPGLLAYVTDHGSQTTAQALLARMAGAKVDTLNLQSVVNLLDDDLSAESLGYQGSDYLHAAVELINQRVLPSIIRTGSGYFLQTEEGTADVASSVFAGSLLIKAGTRTKDSIIEAIGRELIVSALSLADNEGFIPGRLAISGDTVSGSEGFLAPEKIYPWISPQSYFPREIPLAEKVGKGVWAWAA
ncbi:MAG TPA: hypothetical protein VMW69_16745, partial [Spirochaetia bacterium]|nr:hypothetical protein [Spirochaetia bacterium]